MYRRTKIVATVGPACCDVAGLRKLIENGVNVFRLNFSHGTQEQKAEWIATIRELSREVNRAVSIMGDLQGPKIRCGLMKDGGQMLVAGQLVVVTTRDLLGADGLIPTTYRNLPQDVRSGDQILLDDGNLELKVIEIDGEDVRCEVVIGGLLKDRKGINLPGVNVSAPALTEKDLTDLAFCIDQNLDWVALSFVRHADEIYDLKRRLYERKSLMGIIAKIEKPEAVENFNEILEASDGIMVARGDLGVEIQPERVPLIQKRIIHKCNVRGKPVITATQMLESMISNPRPTRAETSDVANAILDGTDAVMLSGETASGDYPFEAVAVMDRVARDVEADVMLQRSPATPEKAVEHRRQPEAIGRAACQIADTVGASAILAFTQTGGTAALVAKFRPSVPVLAVTPTQHVRRRMALFGGVHSLRVDIEGTTEAQIQSVETAVLAEGGLKRGDTVVITMGSPVSAPGTTNLIKVHRLGTGVFYEVQ
jgi:pyruvate kinase